MKSLATFIKEAGITATTQRIMSREDGLMSEPDRDMRHWKVTLIRGNRKMEVLFSQGSAHTSPPTVEDVLDCLASDSSGIDQDAQSEREAFHAVPFEQWASEYGYDTDSRKAETVYKTCLKQAKELKRLLGSPGRSSFGKYRELMCEV